MKRRVFQIVLILVAGAIVNVAVAWGCAWFSMGSWRGASKSLYTEGLLGYPDSLSQDRVGCTYTVKAVAYIPDSLTVGWPSRSVESDLTWPAWQLADSNPLMKQIILASRPRSLAFAINTIFYAAMLWVMFFAPGKLKRTLRRRRGLCSACAYPIGTSPVCTECGAALDQSDKLQCAA